MKTVVSTGTVASWFEEGAASLYILPPCVKLLEDRPWGPFHSEGDVN